MAQLPAELKEVECKVVIGDGTLRMKMSGKGVGGESITLNGAERLSRFG